MKKLIFLIILIISFPIVYSQEIIVLGCQGEISTEEHKLDTSKPDEIIKSIRKVLTEITIDRKNKIIRVQDSTLDICREIKNCTCIFDENTYQCKKVGTWKGDNYESNEEKTISIGRKTGITNYFYYFDSRSKFVNKMVSNTDVSRGQFQCEIQDKNKF